MKRTLKDWRRSLGACCVALAGVGAPTVSLADPADAPPADQNQPVDAAHKQLMAANGLYARGLFKLAADQYAEFLQQNAAHAEATSARYALAVCRYRLHEYDKAVEQLHQVLADPKFEQRDEALAVLGHCELSLGHSEPALAAFDEILSKYPNGKHAELASLNRAQVLYLDKKYADAQKAAAAYLAKHPQGGSRAEALYFQALSQKAQDDNAGAVKTLGELTSQFPDSAHQVDALLLTGQADEALGKEDAAVEAYRQMLAAAPETRRADALYSLGLALNKAGKFDDAAKQLSTLVTEIPSSPFAKPAKLQLGLVQLAGNKLGEARQTLGAVAQEDPQRATDARYGLAQCDIAEKHWDAARQTLDTLMHVQPAPANAAQIALDHAVCTMELQQYQPAATELEQFRTQYPTASQLPEAIYRQAYCLHKLQKYEQSHALCQEVAKSAAAELSGPNQELDAENLYLLAKYPEAEKQFVALADSAKDDARRQRYVFRQGQCEYFAGNYPKAAALLQPLAADPKAAQSPDLQQAMLLLGDALIQQNKHADAIAPLKQYLQVSQTERPQAQYKLGVAELHAKDSAAARQALTEASQGPADSPWAQRAAFELGQLDLTEKKFDEASASFRRVLAAKPPEDVAGPAAYQLGWAEFEAKRFPQAAAAWKEMAANYPKDKHAADAQFQQGVALREAKQYPESATVLQAYAAAHPDGEFAVKATQLAAASLKDAGKNDAAMKLLADLSARAKGPGAESVLYDLAWSQRDAKETAAAEQTYRRLLSESPDGKLAPAARTELAELLYNDQKYDESAGLLEKVVADQSADPKVLTAARYRLGWCYQKAGKPDKAAALFAAASSGPGATDEMNASALLQSGLAYAQDGKFDKAEQALAEMLKKYPTQKDAAVALLKLGEVQAEQQKFDASAASYAEFLSKYPKSEFAYRAEFGTGWALENQKKFEDARKAYGRAIAATNGETAARAQFQIGETYLAEGKFEQAVPALLAVEDVYAYPKWSARALFEAGRAFEQLKQNDQARKQYSQLVSKYKTAPEAEMAQDRLKSIAGL